MSAALNFHADLKERGTLCSCASIEGQCENQPLVHWTQEAGPLSTCQILLSLLTQCVTSSLKGLNKNKSNVAVHVSECQCWQCELGLSQWLLWQVLHDRQRYTCVIFYIPCHFFTDETRKFSKMLNNLNLLFICFVWQLVKSDTSIHLVLCRKFNVNYSNLNIKQSLAVFQKQQSILNSSLLYCCKTCTRLDNLAVESDELQWPSTCLLHFTL